MNEVYKLTLNHYMDDGENRVSLDEPLVVQMIVDRRYTPVPICLNNMMDMMRDEMLRRAGEQE